MFVTYDKFNLRIAQVIRLSISIAMIILIAALIMILYGSPYSKKVAFAGLTLVILTPLNSIMTILMISLKKRRISQFILAITILISYGIAILIAL